MSLVSERPLVLLVEDDRDGRLVLAEWLEIAGFRVEQAQASDPRFAGIPVVVVTAAGSKEDIPAIDADGWLSKPVDFDRLLATIAPLCDRA